jgi:DNA-binding response OmpR family regulator
VEQIMSSSILVINDSGHMRHSEKQQLERQGYLVKETALDFKMPVWTDDNIYDLYIMNFNGSQVDKDDWSRWMRPGSTTPIIVLTSCNDSAFSVQLLDAGADDILLRPFSSDQLLARVRAVLRRVNRTYIAQEDTKVQLGNLTIHMNGRRVFVDEREVRLTRTEFGLLSALVKRLDNVCPHSELLARVWGWEYWDATQYLYVYLGRLRRKLGEQYGNLLETVPGVGYILHSTPEPMAAA